MVKFTVSTGVVKKANQLIINSNKLENVFYNVGKTFIMSVNDFVIAEELLDRNWINIKTVHLI